MNTTEKLLLLAGGFLFFGGGAGGSGFPLSPLPEGLNKYHLKIREAQLKYLDLFKRYAGKKGVYQNVPLQMALAVGHGEGSGNPLAKSSAGARGLMQLMPDTARKMGLKVNKKIDERLDPEKNIMGGVKLLSILFKKYRNWDKVLAAYNSGSPNVESRQKYIQYIRSFLPLYDSFKGL